MVTIRTTPVGKVFQRRQSARANTTDTRPIIRTVGTKGKQVITSQRRRFIPWDRAPVCNEQPVSAPGPVGILWRNIEHWTLGLDLHSEHACDLQWQVQALSRPKPPYEDGLPLLTVAISAKDMIYENISSLLPSNQLKQFTYNCW